MSTIPNAHIARLHASLHKHVDQGAADVICEDLMELPASLSPKRAHSVAETICMRLNTRLDPSVSVQVRKDCACGPGHGHIEKLRRIWRQSDSLADFCARANEAKTGPEYWPEEDGSNERFYFAYSRCFCSFVNKVDKPLARNWCDCTLGFTERLYTGVFARPVQATILEAVKQGGSRCVIRVDIL